MEASVCKYFHTRFCKFGDCYKNTMWRKCVKVWTVVGQNAQKGILSRANSSWSQRNIMLTKTVLKSMSSLKKSDNISVMQEVTSLPATITNMSDQVQHLESEKVKLLAK